MKSAILTGTTEDLETESGQGYRILPVPRRMGKKQTQRGIPETIAETYEGSSLKFRGYYLYIFDIKEMDFVQKNGHNRRFGDSYRFISIPAVGVKNQIEETARNREINLQFRETGRNIYGAVLKEEDLLDVRELLGELEKRYS